MKQTELTRDQSSKRMLAVLLSTVLWLISAVLALACIFALRDIFLWGLGALLTKPAPAHNFQAAEIIDVAHYCFMVILGLVALVFVVGSGEYVRRHAGQPRLL